MEAVNLAFQNRLASTILQGEDILWVEIMNKYI